MQLLWTYCIFHYVKFRFINRENVPAWCLTGINQFKKSLQTLPNLFKNEFKGIIDELIEAERANPPGRSWQQVSQKRHASRELPIAVGWWLEFRTGNRTHRHCCKWSMKKGSCVMKRDWKTWFNMWPKLFSHAWWWKCLHPCPQSRSGCSLPSCPAQQSPGIKMYMATIN